MLNTSVPPLEDFPLVAWPRRVSAVLIQVDDMISLGDGDDARSGRENLAPGVVSQSCIGDPPAIFIFHAFLWCKTGFSVNMLEGL